jgi:hypothetical protein
LVDDGYGIHLSSASRTGGGLIYFSGLHQNDSFARDTSDADSISDSVVDNLIFEEISYDTPPLVPPLTGEGNISFSIKTDETKTFIKSEYADTV